MYKNNGEFDLKGAFYKSLHPLEIFILASCRSWNTSGVRRWIRKAPHSHTAA